MEQETMLKEILNALKLHAEHVDKKFAQMNERFDAIDKRFEQVDQRFERLETKTDGIRMDYTDSQKTIHFLLRKVTEHDEKLLELSQQQK